MALDAVKTRLYQDVARTILDRIEAGEFPPGTRLPGERELAEQLNVSRVTVREAEIALEAQGYISIRTGSGVYVRRDAAGSANALPDISAFELTTARLVIEAEAAALAAVHASDAHLAELRQIVEDMAEAEHDGAESLDQRFHLTIAQATGNPAIEHVITQLWRMRGEVPRVREVYASVCTTDGQARTNEHRVIFDALVARDPGGARGAMREHFRRLFESMMSAREDAAIAELRRSLGEDRQRFLQSMQV